MATIHKCPVCEGSGKVPFNFYRDKTGTGLTEDCRSCKGGGIIWEYYTCTLPQVIYPPMEYFTFAVGTCINE